MMADTRFPDEVPCVLKPATVDELDEVTYLAANPDVAKSGQAAHAHFRSGGQAEGRLQWTNLDLVAQLRERKLARVRLRGQPRSVFATGEAPNFLSDQIIEAFGIPDDVPVSAHQYGAPVLDLIHDNRDKLFLDVGAGLRHIYYANVVNTDIYRSVCTDVMCVGEDLPFDDEQFDFVFCFAVLEHTMRPWDVAREMCRVLKPGGTIMVDWPFLQPVHGYPHHYFNATPTGNKSLFEAYCDVTSLEVAWHHHPAIAVQWILTVWRNGLPAEIARKFEAMAIGNLIKNPIETQLEQDYCVELSPDLKKVIASGSMVTGVKRPGPVPTSPLGADWTQSALARQNAALHQEIDVLRRSTSWRITAPLRALGRRLRGDRR